MAITVGGFTLPITYPLDDNESFLDTFLKMFDGQATPVGATLAIPTGLVFGTYQWNALGGSVATLPVATGSLMRVLMYVSVLATSNSHILYTSSANAVGGTANNFVGVIGGFNNSTGAPLMFAAAATSNTITLNRTTTGSVTLGEWVQAIDLAPNVWGVSGLLSASGAGFATPFSHT